MFPVALIFFYVLFFPCLFLLIIDEYIAGVILIVHWISIKKPLIFTTDYGSWWAVFDIALLPSLL
jgi:hypothetical protein